MYVQNLSLKDGPLNYGHHPFLTDGAGADTSVAALNRFILSMVLFPNVQRKAQEEIDRVIGKQRLPCLEE